MPCEPPHCALLAVHRRAGNALKSSRGQSSIALRTLLSGAFPDLALLGAVHTRIEAPPAAARYPPAIAELRESSPRLRRRPARAAAAAGCALHRVDHRPQALPQPAGVRAWREHFITETQQERVSKL